MQDFLALNLVIQFVALLVKCLLCARHQGSKDCFMSPRKYRPEGASQ